jgi:hypothetical protein
MQYEVLPLFGVAEMVVTVSYINPPWSRVSSPLMLEVILKGGGEFLISSAISSNEMILSSPL